MQIRGQVLSVRPWDFKAQSGERIEMVSIEVYDDTAGVIRGEMRNGGFLPERKSDITATVTGVKKAKFGDGFTMSLKDVLPSMGAPASNPAATVPPPFGKPETATSKK